MSVRKHWDQVYGKYRADQTSWFQARPELSLEFMQATGVVKDAQIIDAGGGASTLVDCLLDEGFTRVSVLDVSRSAIDHAKSRLGPLAHKVQWLESDLRKFVPNQHWDVWHDRAVFHFLTDAADRTAYRAVLRRSLAPGGHVIIATFGSSGPTRCSGLDVVRYGPESLHAELGSDLELVESREHLHLTPSGAEQQFLYCRFRLS